MKILHLHSYYHNGWGFQENLLPRYHKIMGHDVSVITSTHTRYPLQDARTRVPPGEYSDRGVRIIRLPAWLNFCKRFVWMRGLYATLIAEGPDYIMSHEGITSIQSITAARYKKKVKPCLFLSIDNHADWANSGRNWLWLQLYYRLFWRLMIRRISPLVDRFYGITQDAVRFSSKVVGIPEDKLSLLPLGAELPCYIKKERKEIKMTIRKELGVAHTDILIVHAGKIIPRRRTEVLLKAIGCLCNPQLVVAIAGPVEPAYHLKLRRMISRNSRVHFLGWQPYNKLIQLFIASDIAVFPGARSTLWQSAIATGLPVILRDSDESGFLTSKANGHILYSEDHRELEQYIRLLVAYPAVLKDQRNGANQMAKEFLSYNIIARRTLEHLES